jgi:hypothetical protein
VRPTLRLAPVLRNGANAAEHVLSVIAAGLRPLNSYRNRSGCQRGIANGRLLNVGFL